MCRLRPPPPAEFDTVRPARIVHERGPGNDTLICRDSLGRRWRSRTWLDAGGGAVSFVLVIGFAIATGGEIDEPEPNRPEVAVDRVEVDVDAELLSR